MDDLRDDDSRDRQIASIVHSVYLKFFVAGFALGILLFVAGAIASGGPFNTIVRRAGLWVLRVGLLIAVPCVPLALISWFERETTKHPGFREQRLPSRYRTVAWFLVLLTSVLFAAALWFTLSRGLTTWR